MSTVQRRLAAAAVTGLLPLGTFVWAPPALAECTNAGGVTVCAQGDVRGSDSGTGAGSTGLYYPYPCEYDYYCDEWGVDVVLDVDPDLGRPGGPGPRPDNSLPGGGRGDGGRGGRR